MEVTNMVECKRMDGMVKGVFRKSDLVLLAERRNIKFMVVAKPAWRSIQLREKNSFRVTGP